MSEKVLVDLPQHELDPGGCGNVQPDFRGGLRLRPRPGAGDGVGAGRDQRYRANVRRLFCDRCGQWHGIVALLLQVPEDRLGLGPLRTGHPRSLVDEEEGFLGDLPGVRDTAAEAQVLVPVDEPLENLVVDFGAGRIRGEDGVQDAGISDGGVDVFLQSPGVSTGLLVIGRYPEIGLEQEQGEHQGNQYEKTARAQKKLLCALGPLAYN